eukprot:scaffold6585_cov403-Prasinococcus_capsulatus_cf.AAC.6
MASAIGGRVLRRNQGPRHLSPRIARRAASKRTERKPGCTVFASSKKIAIAASEGVLHDALPGMANCASRGVQPQDIFGNDLAAMQTDSVRHTSGVRRPGILDFGRPSNL